MNPHLIELQDHDIRVRTEAGVLASSPGFASIAGEKPVFGEEARKVARLHPRESFNQFWTQLSLDPLALKNRHFRHSADLAHTHLDQLTRGLEFEHGAVIAAPSNYSRNQLGVLLGVVRQCAFEPVGLVDLALLQASGTDAEESIVIELQLHQAVLTSFRRVDGQLVRDRLVQVPASGLLSLQDAWSNLITDAFIKQCRFDPQHNAETEQYVYNQLGYWLAQAKDASELLLEINHKGTVYQAHLTQEQFAQRGKTILTRIAQELDALRGANSVVLMSAANLALPGVALYLPSLVALDDDSAMAATLRHLEHIRRPADSLHFVTRMPLEQRAGNAAPLARNATHVLFRHKAIALPLGRLLFGTPPPQVGDSARVVPVPELAALGGALSLLRGPRGVQLERHGDFTLLHNGSPAGATAALTLGDRLQLGTDGPLLQLITVE